MTAHAPPPPPPKPCPVCGKARVERWRPFCSKRCADVDLARWFSGVYVVPGRAIDDGPDGDLPDGTPR